MASAKVVRGWWIGAAAGAVLTLGSAAWLLAQNESGQAAPALVASGPTSTLTTPRLTQSGRLKIVVEPSVQPVAVGVTHEWLVGVSDVAGTPAIDCKVRVDGTMPAHGHGLPTAPRVTGREGGTYRVEGVRFSMPGLWRMAVSVAACGGSAETARADAAEFDLHL